MLKCEACQNPSTVKTVKINNKVSWNLCDFCEERFPKFMEYINLTNPRYTAIDALEWMKQIFDNKIRKGKLIQHYQVTK